MHALGGRPRYRHAANSAATLRDSRVWYDFVRPGLLLHGVVPPPLHTTLPLKAVMSLTSRVVAVKGVRAGEAVGYGGRFRPQVPTTLAVIPAGYADGLDRRLEERGEVLVRGRRARIVGAVSMDMLTVDVTDIEDVSPGDEVVFLGAQGSETTQRLDAREMASEQCRRSLTRFCVASERACTGTIAEDSLRSSDSAPAAARESRSAAPRSLGLGRSASLSDKKGRRTRRPPYERGAAERVPRT